MTAQSGDGGADVRPAGWYSRTADLTRQTWHNGTEWTMFERVSRFPTFVERDGQLAYLDRRFFPRGPGEFERLSRRFHQRLLWTLLVLLVFPLPLAMAMAATGVDITAAAGLAVGGCMVVGFVLAVSSIGTGMRLFRTRQDIRDRFDTDTLYVPVSPPRGAKEKAKARRKGAPPGWV